MSGRMAFRVEAVSIRVSPFDTDDVLSQWVEHDKAPASIVAAHLPPGPAAHTPDRTRPLCAYPRVAKYTGTGSIDDASNFVCIKQDFREFRLCGSGCAPLCLTRHNGATFSKVRAGDCSRLRVNLLFFRPSGRTAALANVRLIGQVHGKTR